MDQVGGFEKIEEMVGGVPVHAAEFPRQRGDVEDAAIVITRIKE